MTQWELGKNQFQRYNRRRRVEKTYTSNLTQDRGTVMHNAVMWGNDGVTLFDGEWIQWKGGKDTALAYKAFMLYRKTKEDNDRKTIFRTFKRFRRIARTSEPEMVAPRGTPTGK